MIYKLNTVLKFGKYKGHTVEEIIENGDGDYLEWALDNIEWFELDEESQIKLDNYLYTNEDIDWENILC